MPDIQVVRRSNPVGESVRTRASFRITGVERPRRQLVINPEPRPQRRPLVISPADVVPLVVTRPRDNAVIHVSECSVQGSGISSSTVWLKVNDYSSNTACNEDGRFTFRDVPLRPGRNVLMVGDSNSVDPKVKLVTKLEDPFLAKKAVDPITKGAFKAGDIVVRCANDMNYYLNSTWNELRGVCPSCKGRSVYRPEDAQFWIGKGSSKRSSKSRGDVDGR